MLLMIATKVFKDQGLMYQVSGAMRMFK